MRRVAVAAAGLALGALGAGTAAAQTASPRCSPGPADCRGWFARDVTLSWSLAGVTDTRDCDVVTFRRDGVFARTCLVSNDGTNFLPFYASIHLDKTAPRVTGVAPSRGADHDGWYRSPVGVRFFGDDATSGVAGCSAGTYSGPDAAAAQVLGRCWDRAGNVSAPGSFSLRYDATAPSLARVSASGRDHRVKLAWNVPDATSVEVRRAGSGRRHLRSGGPTGSVSDRRLRNGRRYRYVVKATDAAGNTSRRTLRARPGPRLFGPANGARLAAPPRLRWTKVIGADYYNVQVFRGRRKILSLWPSRPRLQLTRTWRYGGRARRLAAGRRYRWFVWPGKGRRAENDYGRRIGARTFVFAP